MKKTVAALSHSIKNSFKKIQAPRKAVVDIVRINDILSRGVEDIFVKASLEKKLLSGKPLRIKFGIDPTSPQIHLGRAVPLRKLKALQDLGHTIVFIIGDFTAQVGDPSDKISKRPMLTRAAIKQNLKGYMQQAGKIINLSRTEIHYNSTWLDALGFQEISELAEAFSVQQMSSRRNFTERFERGEEVSLREFLYPLMQGYDSVKVNADVEIGGFDQLFNLKAGRTVQKYYGQPEQDVLTVKMLEGTDGRKMSSSWGNVISLLDTANDMYGKLMAVRDDLLPNYLLLTTDTSLSEIETIVTGLAAGTLHPKEVKMNLARTVVTLYHGAKAAHKAEQAFVNTFSKGEIPTDIPEIVTTAGSKIGDILAAEKIVDSKSDWRRLVDEKAVTILRIGEIDTEEKIIDPYIVAEQTLVLRVGKKRFVRVVVK